MRGVAVQEIMLAYFVQLVHVIVSYGLQWLLCPLSWSPGSPSLHPAQYRRSEYSSNPSLQPLPLPTDDVAASLSYNYGELYHTCIDIHSWSHTASLLSTSWLSKYTSRTCRPQLHAVLCSSQSLFAPLGIVSSVCNLLLKINQAIFEMTIIRGLR